jgi:hypothetical protein
MSVLLLPVPEGSVEVPLPAASAAERPLLAVLVPPGPGERFCVGVVAVERALPTAAGVPVLPALGAWLLRRTSPAGQVEVVPTPLGPAVGAVDVLGAEEGPVTSAEVALPLSGDRLLLVSASVGGDQPARVAGLLGAALRRLAVGPRVQPG